MIKEKLAPLGFVQLKSPKEKRKMKLSCPNISVKGSGKIFEMPRWYDQILVGRSLGRTDEV